MLLLLELLDIWRVLLLLLEMGHHLLLRRGHHAPSASRSSTHLLKLMEVVLRRHVASLLLELLLPWRPHPSHPNRL